LALWALIVSMPIFGPLAVVGSVLGFFALRRTDKMPLKGRGMAIAAIVVGLASLTVWLAVLGVLAGLQPD